VSCFAGDQPSGLPRATRLHPGEGRRLSLVDRKDGTCSLCAVEVPKDADTGQASVWIDDHTPATSQALARFSIWRRSKAARSIDVSIPAGKEAEI
jgi:hypothetical protein